MRFRVVFAYFFLIERMRSLSRAICISLLLFILPAAVSAAASWNLSGVRDDATVTRGDFIRAAVQALGLEGLEVDQRKDLPYRRVSKGLEPFIRVAHKKNALEAFGFDLVLAQGISRGDALRVVTNLTGFDSATPAPFKDARIGTPEERAVRLGVARGWMEPIRNDLFGVRRLLTGREAKLLLGKLAGAEETKTQEFLTNPPTIKFNLQTNTRIMNLPKTQILETIWSAIQKEFLYIDNINVDEAAFKAAEGLVGSLGDKYTTFMRPVRARQFQSQIQGEVTGIGAQVEYLNEVLTIVSPIKGSPAEAAGLKAGDKVIKVDGEKLAGLDFLAAVEKVRGPKGSKVKLTINRDGLEFDVDVIRDVIRVPEATISWQGDVLVIQISQFGKITDTDLRPGLIQALNKTPKGVVLDLRSNPGGLLHAADTVVSLFVPRGTPYVEVRSRSDDTKPVTSLDPVLLASVPMVVLINEGSASASEIVAGALQDLKRATVVGAKSFGKGTVQQVLQFTDESSLKMTIAEWFTPNGKKIDGIGVFPDIGVSEVEGRDAVLLKALELLR